MSETHVEYRVVGEGREGPSSANCGESLSRAQARAEEMRRGSQFIRTWKNVRIQQRTVIETPWKDIPDE